MVYSQSPGYRGHLCDQSQSGWLTSHTPIPCPASPQGHVEILSSEDTHRLCIPKLPPPGTSPRPSTGAFWALNFPLTWGVCSSLCPACLCQMPRGPSAMNEMKVWSRLWAQGGSFSDAAQSPLCLRTAGGRAPVEQTFLRVLPLESFLNLSAVTAKVPRLCLPLAQGQPGSRRALLLIKSMGVSPWKAFKSALKGTNHLTIQDWLKPIHIMKP